MSLEKRFQGIDNWVSEYRRGFRVEKGFMSIEKRFQSIENWVSEYKRGFRVEKRFQSRTIFNFSVYKKHVDWF